MKNYKFEIFFYVFILTLLLLLAVSVRGQDANQTLSGGQFSLAKSIAAGGGGSSSGNFFSVASTAGQPVAGMLSSGGAFSIYSGFWSAAYQPSGLFTISGKITSSGNPLSGALVSLSGSSNQTAFTDSSGNYSFPTLPAAGSYTVTPALTNYIFNPANQSFAILLSDQTANFTATAQNCSYSIDPSGVNAPSSGAAGTITVATQAGCNWTAIANNKWISITSANSGAGAGTVSYSVEANSGSARSGSIMIA
ncbi:MAG TPA: carboxypeptidase regulatory-like domain-containing protein, partial [Pyrinomonadaceae bacterium]|nr:carboxypeptidase regulatory-like domain-containing protein [Pyrinomonadaceae bacterium]